jgi:glycosyltransferase involved in cell wall biosynthesis
MSNRSQADVISTWLRSTEPLVSVCCITYNHVSYISEAIDSFLMQETSFPFEILVHDDASTDGTEKIILAYAENYPGIIRAVIQTENQYSKAGLIAHRFLFPKAKGKYIALCEGDDYWTDSTKLQKQVQFLEDHPEYVITYTNSQPFDEKGLVNIDFGGAKRDVSADELKKGIPMYTLTTCFRNVFREIPMDLLSAKLGDVIIWSLLGAYGKGKYLADILPAAYRVHKEGVFSMQSEQQKIRMTLITSNALFAYYNRIGDIDNGLYFGEQSIKLFIKLIGWNRLITMITEKILTRLIQMFKKFR